MLKGKNQAFVEYESESSAQSLVNVAEACPMAIRGRTIFCQFSTHQELKTDRKAATKDGSILGGEEISASTGNLPCMPVLAAIDTPHHLCSMFRWTTGQYMGLLRRLYSYNHIFWTEGIGKEPAAGGSLSHSKVVGMQKPLRQVSPSSHTS
uniref:RRM domain-containing protein n=1 Tax=Ditylenchus dipsaci TaxID=166011 RepID=A0A915ECX5_9BILA